MANANSYVTNVLGSAAALLLLPGLASSNPNEDSNKPAQGASEKIVGIDQDKLYQEASASKS